MVLHRVAVTEQNDLVEQKQTNGNLDSICSDIGQIYSFNINYGFESRQGIWIHSCEEDFQITFRTSVVLSWCPFVSLCTSTTRESPFDLYRVDAA
jgi:hypothetical protein